jgi:hypothetical protein
MDRYKCGCEVNYHGGDTATIACPIHGKPFSSVSISIVNEGSARDDLRAEIQELRSALFSVSPSALNEPEDFRTMPTKKLITLAIGDISLLCRKDDEEWSHALEIEERLAQAEAKLAALSTPVAPAPQRYQRADDADVQQPWPAPVAPPAPDLLALVEKWRKEAELHRIYLPDVYHAAAIEYKQRCANELAARLQEARPVPDWQPIIDAVLKLPSFSEKVYTSSTDFAGRFITCVEQGEVVKLLREAAAPRAQGDK